MTRRILDAVLGACACLTLIVTTACASDVDGQAPSDDAKRLSAAHNHFGFNLFHQVATEGFSENIFISPASAAFALAMLYNGAAGLTQAEMTEALQIGGLSLDAVNAANSALLKSLNEGEAKVELSVANSIWCRDPFKFRSDFLDRTRQSYMAEIRALDFNDPKTVDVINNWVKASTREKITNIIDQISPLDVMFLINAVYFKGTWAHQFDKSRTEDRPFHLLGGTTADVPMMRQTRTFKYLGHETFQAIRLPYGSGSFSMYLFLPAKDYGLERFVADVTPENWAKWTGAFASQEVYIRVPRFKLEDDHSFNDALKSMGMKSAFDEQAADLTGLWDPAETMSPNLYVSFVRQKTYVDVNEEGTEAAAVTGIGVATASMPPTPIEMTIDRPFFCAIVDDTTGLILFMGAIVDPSSD